MPTKLLRSSIDYETMVRETSECLKKLDVEYVTNGHDFITEFEVTQPAYFRLVLEPNKIPKVRSLAIMQSISAPTGSTLEIRFGLDDEPDQVSLASSNVIRFLRLLIESLPKKPWMGLGMMESGSEEKKWKQWLALGTEPFV
ncbi:MAG: hypothetical protein ACYCQJ_04420 [Nitrososphaerales archaeon]